MREIRQITTLPDLLRASITTGATRALCPSCGGGRSRELSLSIRQLEVASLVKLSCFRASCGYYSTVVVDSSVSLERTKLKQATPYTDDTLPVDTELAWRLGEDYGLRATTWEPHGWCVGPAGQLVLPVRDPYGRVRGHMTRTFDSPKRVYTYKTTAQPWLDWWPQSAIGATVIVEDCLSACRLAGLGYNAVALLGTGINVGQAREIAAHGSIHDPVFLALDRDAFVKSVKLAERHRHVLKMLPICLTQDIKNMDSDDNIRALFGGNTNG